MKMLCGTAFILLFIGGVIFTSCRKEKSCPGCSEHNKAPIAVAGPDLGITLSTDSIYLDGAASHDPDGTIVKWLWRRISGPATTIYHPSSPRTAVQVSGDGLYKFELYVMDNGGLYAKDTVQVAVTLRAPSCTTCRIVFVSNRDGNDEIYSSNTNGAGIQRLTNSDGTDDHPSWSPDGKRIAFTSNRAGYYELFTMNADGSGVERMTFSRTHVQDPSWSPDGTKILYSTITNGSMNIWVIHVIDKSQALLFEAPGYDVHPAWSPDGTKIALVSDWAAYDFVLDINMINADGTGHTALTGNIYDNKDYANPSWSPGGSKLAMAVMHNQYDTQVGVMNADGTGFTVFKWAAPWTRTSWSGDGTKIAYNSLSGSRRDVAWVSANGFEWGTILTNAWNADWQH